MSTFSKGDRVRCVETWTTHVIDSGDEFTVDDVDPTAYPNPTVFVQGEWVPAHYFEKVEPEWVVGQQVSGDDYERLPVGATAVDKDGDRITKTEGDPILWKTDAGKICWPLHPRTLSHLPDAPEPEDTDDAEPEPLKGGDWVQVWAQVERLRSDGDTICRFFYGVEHEDGTPKYFFGERIRDDAIVRPSAGQVPPWVKSAQCTSLVECDEGAGVFYLRCSREQHEGDDTHRLSESGIDDLAWTDAEAYGRVETSS